MDRYNYDVRVLYMALFMLILLMILDTSKAADVTVAWDPPTENQDGTPLTDLAGYKIYYGKTSFAEGVVNVADPAATSATITGLESGARYAFVATAYDTDGNESEHSNQVIYLTPPDIEIPNAPGSISIRFDVSIE